MSTLAQVAELVAPFLERHPHFVRVGRKLVRVPVAHVEVGFRIDRFGFKGSIRPLWFAGTCFSFPPSSSGGVAVPMDRVSGAIGKPGMADRFVAELTQIADDKLRCVKGLEDLLAFEPAPGMHRPKHPGDEGLLLAALGRLKEATVMLDAELELRAKMALGWEDAGVFKIDSEGWRRHKQAQMAYSEGTALCEKARDLAASGDSSGLAQLLHDLERRSISVSGIERFWRTTPFPLELGATV